MRSLRKPLLALAGVTALLTAGCQDDDKAKKDAEAAKKPPARGRKAPPKREVSNPTNCPPNDGRKKAAIQKPPDRDVNGDMRDDYFAGSFVFVDKAGNDLVVTLWCIDREPKVEDGKIVQFNDFFAFEVATSKPGQGEVVKLPPRAPI